MIRTNLEPDLFYVMTIHTHAHTHTRTGAGTETRAIVEMGMGTRMGPGTRI